MDRKSIRKSLLILLILIISIFLFLWSCSFTPKYDKNGNPIHSYKFATELDFPDVEEPYKYIFLRMYNVNYSDPFYIANILRFGINATEVSEISGSHMSINFSLNDDFYGLTSGGKYQLAQESCVNVKSNKYMKKCDADSSTQITYALRVPESEYYKAKEFVEKYAADKRTKYRVLENFRIAAFATKRKFFTKKEEQQFGTVKYPAPKKKELDPNFEEHKFVCSTFVAYTLMKNVSSVADWFDEKEINYRYVNVTDIPQIPGVVELFSSKFYEYDDAAEIFVEKFPEFEEYLNLIEAPKVKLAS